MTAPEQPRDGIRWGGLILGLLTYVVLTPITWLLTLAVNENVAPYLGAAALLATLGVIGWLLYGRSKSFVIGLAAGYVVATLLTQGICTGWAEFTV